jgi:hypothetical protein
VKTPSRVFAFRRGAALAGLWCAALTLAPQAAAQRVTSTVDVGGAGIRYGDSVSTSAVTVAPTIRFDWPRAMLTGAGAASQLGAGGWSTQGRLDGSLFTPAFGPLVGEAFAAAGGSAHRDGTRTGEALAGGRVHLMRVRGGVWGGGGAGRTWSDGAWRVVRLAEGGAWARGGPSTALVSVVPTAVDDTIRYVDGTVAVRVDVVRLELGGFAGLRSGASGARATGGPRSWGGASVMLWLTDRVGATLGVGTYPLDLSRGFPGGRYASLSLRLASAGARASGQQPASHSEVSLPPAAREARARAHGVLAFSVEALAGDRRTVRVHAPGARSIEVAGDFTGWQPLALARAGNGWWTLALPVPRGTYQMNVRVDGHDWIVPPGVPTTDDEFGGSVGVLVVK